MITLLKRLPITAKLVIAVFLILSGSLCTGLYLYNNYISDKLSS